jgi:putative membrane protein
MAAMPSNQRFHPLTVLFALGGELRNFLLPALFATMTASRGNGFERFLLVFLVPGAIAAVARYLSSTYRYDATELVVRTGIIFRNERHIPYARIQSVDAVQNVLHRWFSVVDVKVQTGTGGEAEATLSVLPFAALDDMRRRVFEDRPRESDPVTTPGSDDGASVAMPVPEARTLLQLPSRELALAGLLDNRGWVVIGAAWGVLFESGVIDRFKGWDSAAWPLYASALFALFVIAPVLSMLWATVRLHGFSLTQRGGDLLIEYGALTRVTATIPLRRVQAIKILQGPGHLWTGRASVKVETAGGSPTGRSAAEREWIAPIIRMADVPAFVATVLPAADLSALDWQAVDPRGYQRRLRLALVWAAVVSGATAPWLGGVRAAGVGLVLAAWWVMSARFYVRSLGWARTERLMAFKSGWVRRAVTIVPLDKIQAVDLEESPFDRRWSMACLRVDTAGAGAHRIDIPYLSRPIAEGARVALAREAAGTTFRW